MCATSSSKQQEGKTQHEEARDGPPSRAMRVLSPFAVLLASNILETLALAIILPAYPGLCKEIGIDLKTRGWMISVYSLLQFIMSPLLGRASDVLGRTTMLR